MQLERSDSRAGAPRAPASAAATVPTIVFGIVALGVVEVLLKPDVGDGVAVIGGALAFAIGLVFLIVGRTELFTEKFFGPVAVVFQRQGRSVWLQLGRLWLTLLILNLAGGLVLTAVMTVPGALTPALPRPW